jgi:hypothetical protein
MTTATTTLAASMLRQQQDVWATAVYSDQFQPDIQRRLAICWLESG